VLRKQQLTRLCEEVPAAVAEQEDTEGVRPPAPHAEFDKLIRRSNGLKMMTVDSAAARRLLAINTSNRRVSQRRVAQLASQMRLGHFENTVSPSSSATRVSSTMDSTDCWRWSRRTRLSRWTSGTASLRQNRYRRGTGFCRKFSCDPALAHDWLHRFQWNGRT